MPYYYRDGSRISKSILVDTDTELICFSELKDHYCIPTWSVHQNKYWSIQRNALKYSRTSRKIVNILANSALSFFYLDIYVCVCGCHICSEHLDLFHFFLFSSGRRGYFIIYRLIICFDFVLLSVSSLPWVCFLRISSQILRVMLNVLHHVCRSCFRVRRKTVKWWITTTIISRRRLNPWQKCRPLTEPTSVHPLLPMERLQITSLSTGIAGNRRSWLNWPRWRTRP
jgi:hypothetical protein